MMDSFACHGTFIYEAGATINRYAALGEGAQGVAVALKQLGMTHAWIRLFGATAIVPDQPTRALVTALRSAGINLAGWGYCHGADWQSDARNTVDQLQKFDLDAFVVDLEPGNDTSLGRTRWSRDDLRRYFQHLLDHQLGRAQLVVSTWPLLKEQNDYDAIELMRVADGFVSGFAPQVYWHNKASAELIARNTHHPANYHAHDPVSFIDLCLDQWSELGFAKPIILTGQTYWGDGGPHRAAMEAKLEQVLGGFTRWQDIAALNWWHLGSPPNPDPAKGDANGSMSPAMFDAIAAAKLDAKPYAQAAPGLLAATEEMTMSALSDLVPLPPPGTMNVGLSACREATMMSKFGRPGELTEDCSDPTGEFRKHVKWGVNVGPFKVSGLAYAVESLHQIFDEVKQDNPELFNQVKTEGMLCVRHRRHNPARFSNHSWGTAVDLYFGKKVVDQGVHMTHRGNLLLMPYFNRYGWYWGAGFSGDSVDSMHFELADETVLKMPDLLHA